MPARRKRVAVFATEPVTEKVGGLGIRQLECARALSRRFDVRLLSTFAVGDHKEKFSVIELPDYRPHSVEAQVRWADVICTTRPDADFLRLVKTFKKPVAVDLFASLYFERLEDMRLRRMTPEQTSIHYSGMIEDLRRHLSLGDFFICASERERDYYLGILTNLGKLRPEIYRKDKQFLSIIAVVPFGIPKAEPKRGQSIIRGKIPGVGKNDFLIVSSGSLWDWYDYETPIRAMARLKRSCPKVKLVYLGVKHPALKRMPKAYKKLVNLAEKHRVLGKNVFIHPEWIPYDRRERYLTEADAGLASFTDHIENRFAFRIRVVDYLWGNLPVITNPGNTLSEFIGQKGLGEVFPFGDDKVLAEKIKSLASRPGVLREIKKRIFKEKKAFHWESILKPLVNFCSKPRKVSPIFDDNLFKLSFYDLNRLDVRRAVFLRSSPMWHSVEALSALRKVYPNAKIDVVVQPGVDVSPLGNGVNFIRLPKKKFTAQMARQLFSGRNGRKHPAYDVVVCSFTDRNLSFYNNVIDFAAKIPAKRYLAFNDEYCFADIGPLCEAAKKRKKRK
ncbi:MAG: glycosyltransferase family 4 protein [Nitrospinota bacterium]